MTSPAPPVLSQTATATAVGPSTLAPSVVTSASSMVSRALAVEVGRLDEVRARGWAALGLVMLIASLFMALVDVRNGVPGIALGLSTLAWFWVRRLALRAGAARPVATIDLLVESTIAPAILALLAVFAGPVQALNGFGPTLAYCGVIILSMLRLQALVTFGIGAASAIAMYAVALVVVPPVAVTGDPSLNPIQLGIRYGSFLFASAMTAGVVFGLRSAVGSVVRSIREKDLFGKYRLEREIAVGGMGAVWSATYCPEGGFERPAAVKLVRDHLGGNPAFVAAFRAEAALSARLVHDAIVQVFDFGRVDGRYFLAMERVDGVTLRRLMKRSWERRIPVPATVVGAVGRSLLSALAYAHEDARAPDGSLLRVIHRDVAPANVLISWRGVAKLTDFGIAKVLGDQVSANTDNIVGHFDYMAPEQVDGKSLDARTDLFAAGILLWELVCGRPLFQRSSQAATLRAVLGDEVPPPSSFSPELARFDAFFARALARPPEGRFASAREMAAALAPLASGTADDVGRFIASLDLDEPEGPAREGTSLTG